jgi:hypothetical protein
MLAFCKKPRCRRAPREDLLAWELPLRASVIVRSSQESIEEPISSELIA